MHQNWPVLLLLFTRLAWADPMCPAIGGSVAYVKTMEELTGLVAQRNAALRAAGQYSLAYRAVQAANAAGQGSVTVMVGGATQTLVLSNSTSLAAAEKKMVDWAAKGAQSKRLVQEIAKKEVTLLRGLGGLIRGGSGRFASTAGVAAGSAAARTVIAQKVVQKGSESVLLRGALSVVGAALGAALDTLINPTVCSAAEMPNMSTRYTYQSYDRLLAYEGTGLDCKGVIERIGELDLGFQCTINSRWGRTPECTPTLKAICRNPTQSPLTAEADICTPEARDIFSNYFTAWCPNYDPYAEAQQEQLAAANAYELALANKAPESTLVFLRFRKIGTQIARKEMDLVSYDGAIYQLERLVQQTTYSYLPKGIIGQAPITQERDWQSDPALVEAHYRAESQLNQFRQARLTLIQELESLRVELEK